MSDIGAIGSYILATQTAQISMIKQSAEMQQMALDILLNGDANRTVSASETHGQNVDISV